MRILLVTLLLALLPLAAADAPGSAYYSAPGSIVATHVAADGDTTTCVGEDLFTVDYQRDPNGMDYSYLDASSFLNRCGWSVEGFVIGGSLIYWGCAEGADQTTCYRDPSLCWEGPDSCWGSARVLRDGSIEASGYDEFDEYDEDGNFLGVSSTTWSFTVDVAQALPLPVPFA